MRIKVYKKYEGRGWAIVDYMGWLWYNTKFIKMNNSSTNVLCL